MSQPVAVQPQTPVVVVSKPNRRRDWTLPGWAVSTVVHAVFLSILLFIPMSARPKIEEIIIEQESIDLPTETEMVQDVQQPAEILPEPQSLMADSTPPADVPPINSTAGGDNAGAVDGVDEGGPVVAVTAALDSGASGAMPVGKGRTEGFTGRGAGKGVMLGKGGGTLATEYAVKAGLDWFIKHQFPDGSWHIDYSPKSTGATTGVGEVKSNMAATSLALLPFLAANHTHQTGSHRNIVKKALNWMLQNQRADGLMLGKFDGQRDDQSPMYTHGLATIVLCEAYALTKDKSLGTAAQKAVNFTCRTQNKLGGWRYLPNSPDADTSVFGWQFMSLKSAMMAGLKVPEKNLSEARKYLNSVKSGKHGGLFAYEASAKPNPSMTAIGLLSNQYLGSGRDDGQIKEGVEYLVKNAPPERTTHPYYWYYGTQVVHHYQGAEWDRWNRAMRKIWVEKQNRDQKSTDFGSWAPSEFNREMHDLKAGGRLYLTSLGLLTLEVYYRYLPLYENIGADGMKGTSESDKPERAE